MTVPASWIRSLQVHNKRSQFDHSKLHMQGPVVDAFAHCMTLVSVLPRLRNLSHVLFLDAVPHAVIVSILTHPHVVPRLRTVDIIPSGSWSDLSYLAAVPTLPNVSSFRIKPVYSSREVKIPAIPEMPQCRVLELVGYPDFVFNPTMHCRFAQCLTCVKMLTIGDSVGVGHGGDNENLILHEATDQMRSAFPGILAQLRHAKMPPSVLTWLLGKPLEDDAVEELVAPHMPLLAPNLTHLRLASWDDDDQVRWCHALMDLTSLVFLTGDDEQEEDDDRICLTRPQVLHLARLPNLQYLNLPVEDSPDPETEKQDSNSSISSLPSVAFGGVSQTDLFFPSLVSLTTSVTFFGAVGSRTLPALESMSLCISTWDWCEAVAALVPLSKFHPQVRSNAPLLRKIGVSVLKEDARKLDDFPLRVEPL
ncbi:hypothetical protein AMAG_10404 [Allomyces macrogynus ATCC 38327]|uniref:Uncharacterized protein n=1 Tax=Allomyces macrogynus (strain ATCC 38327) TaxID=578462 RepID=A0A0L0SUU2_ALLM3|nr:hypothetical protein AMAG_10404 [Allomyces macrogynus ATCC 38327]|eukprot:KNE66155.1 hypothetical protein AMAG_10404 [Allomyces macrogynus ATCC 38327]